MRPGARACRLRAAKCEPCAVCCGRSHSWSRREATGGVPSNVSGQHEPCISCLRHRLRARWRLLRHLRLRCASAALASALASSHDGVVAVALVRQPCRGRYLGSVCWRSGGAAACGVDTSTLGHPAKLAKICVRPKRHMRCLQAHRAQPRMRASAGRPGCRLHARGRTRHQRRAGRATQGANALWRS